LSGSPASQDGIRERIARPPGWKLRIVGEQKNSVSHFAVSIPKLFLKAQAHRITGPISRKLMAFCFSGSAGEKAMLFDFSSLAEA